MKRLYFCILLSCTTFGLTAQNTWTQKANFGGGLRRTSACFVINGKGYVGIGQDPSLTYKNDFWEYDPVNDSWSQKANFPGTPRNEGAGFAINGKGYIGLGYPGSSTNDFWEYTPGNNTWKQVASIPGVARYNVTAISIGNKGYVGLGIDWNNTSNQGDFWQYDGIANSWTQKANFGGGARRIAAGFSINGKGYMGTGYTSSNQADLWEYDTLANSWTQKAAMGGAARFAATGFSIGNKGYIGVGMTGVGNYLQDFWEYDPVGNSWVQRANFPAVARSYVIGFGIGNKGYLGTGEEAVGVYRQDFWEYSPLSSINISIDPAAIPCYGGSEGSASASVSGGTSPYTYSWSPGGQTNQMATGLTAGTYTVLVTDASGSTQTKTVAITQPTQLFVSATPSGNTAIGGAAGGTTPYTYMWSPGGQTTSTATGLTAASYTLTVTDANGCTQMAIASFVGIGELNAGEIKIYPNPFRTEAVIVLQEEMKTASLVVYNLEGKEVKNIRFSGKQVTLDRKGLANGVYFCKVLSQDGVVIAVQRLVVQ